MTIGAIKNKNGTQNLLTKTIAAKIPKLRTYANSDDPIAHVKFYLQDLTWFCCEYDPTDGTMFGLVYSSACPQGEFGNFNIHELASLSGRIGNAVERDKFFEPMAISEIQKRNGVV